ncbi:unnamed protein product [Caenorhabditis angaria]|uniref:Anaphase-promoting complex subunit 4 WD40 domain-containing protein n=1 Tax=Caenorhabditis angaria TaxID=860376 RepID=A0A9P1MXI1_9PELO|nr:unnamed protein product [Caenorhabditis angaria]
MAELLDKNYGAAFPEELDGPLDLQNGAPNCCKFNRWGTLVAVGCADGRVFIVDFITKNPVKVFTAHALPLSGISWSRDGRKLLTCSMDQTIAVWNVLTGQMIERIRYNSAILSAHFNPRDDNKCIVLRTNSLPTMEQINPRIQKVLTNDTPGASDDIICAISYDRKAKYIITGTGKGKIIFYNADTLKCVSWCKQSSSQQVRQIIVPPKSNFILTNSQDRIIRTYVLNDLLNLKGATVEAQYKVQDMVNKAAWKSVCTDSDGIYICGASTKAHSLYIWESNTGSLIKILHGTKGESLMDVQWHPTRPVILSVSQATVSLWTQAHVENWSAFAPEFQELEENEKYQEKEGEFDMEDEDAEEEIKKDLEEEEDIDVVGLKPEEYLASSDEEDLTDMKLDQTLRTGPLWYIPIAPDVDNPENLTSATLPGLEIKDDQSLLAGAKGIGKQKK